MKDLFMRTNKTAVQAPLRSQKSEHNRLEVILKVAERCNINCSYCYFFNGADDSFRFHPASISYATIVDVANFLVQGARDLHLEEVQIDFHGGEPMLLGKKRFAEICTHFQSTIGAQTKLTLCIQTNATLIDQGWIDLFGQHRIRVGVSLDGPADYHDAARVDFRGGGTYQRTVHGIQLLHQAVDHGQLDGFGVLCVINPKHSARRIYQHFINDLNITNMDFLLPDITHTSFTGNNAEEYGHFLCDLFDIWMEDDNPDIRVRVLNSILSLLLGGLSWVHGYGLKLANAITISSDGSLGPDDTLRACGSDIVRSRMDVVNTKLSNFLSSAFITEINAAHHDIASTCQCCCWFQVCGGGLMVNRYRKDEGFKNPSVFCNGLKMFYTHIAACLLSEGLPLEYLQAVLLEASEMGA